MALLTLLKTPAAWWSGGYAATTRWMESTLEVARWENMRKAGRRWAWWGAVLGALLGVVMYAPACWLAQGIVVLSHGRVLLAESQGTVWNGDAVVVLTGGPGSRDARSLPGRLSWTLRPSGLGLKVSLQQDCCVPQAWLLDVRVGLNKVRVSSPGLAGHWPAAWLTGLGTPWNTLELGGVMRVSSQAVAVEWAAGHLLMDGQVHLALDDVSSRVTPLDRLGSYRLEVMGNHQDSVGLQLSTVDGALQLSGQGRVGLEGVRFTGEARANESERGALDNFLNLVGRRMGDRSVISIG